MSETVYKMEMTEDGFPVGKRVPRLPEFHDEPLHNDLRELIDWSAEKYADMDAFIIKHKVKGEDPTYEHVTYRRLRKDIQALGTGFMERGYKDKRIAVIGKNRYEWMLVYLATMMGLGVCVPLDKGLPYEELESSLIRSKSDVLVFDPEQRGFVEELQEKGNTGVSEFISMDEIGDYDFMGDIIRRGYELMGDGDDSFTSLPIDRDAMALLMFTSGTTSLSKAVMLSNYNITHNVYEVMSTEDFVPGDVNMALLPFHHTFGSTGQCMWLSKGINTCFCDGLKYIQKNMAEYGVSVFICVPLVIESMHKKIMAGIKKQGKEKTFERGLKIANFLEKLHIDVRRRLFKEILDQLGGQLRFLVSGASPLDPLAVKGFNDLGITVVQGYGLTETSPVLAGEDARHLRAGSIGHAMPGVDLVIVDPDEDGIGELVARCPSVMLGYYDAPEATAEVMEGEWFHTGDLASVDEDGYLYIQGRKKTVIVLKNGKNIYPEELELLISNLPYVEENLVYGEPRHKDGDAKDLAVCARVVYNKEIMESLNGKITPEEAEAIVKKDIEAINDSMPTYKRINRVTVTDEPMEKTTTGKVKRYNQKL